MALVFIVACTDKPKATVQLDKKLQLPLKCLNLNTIGIDKAYKERLESLYSFDKNCKFRLDVSYKKDIVCNSSYNSMAKSTGKFPKSFLKLEVRKGFDTKYSYYIDLLDNVQSDDVEVAFRRLKNDILSEHK
jgi:hypothetical protein